MSFGATSAYYLNDSAEITYGYGILKAVIEDWIARNPRPEMSLALGMARDLLDGFGDDLLNRNLITPTYLACFCEEDNLLSQWRAYGESGGYSLAFSLPSSDLNRKFKPEPNNYTSRLIQVVYDRSTQIGRCRKILDSLLPIFDDEEVARAIRALGTSEVFGFYALRRLIADILIEEAVSFKNGAFNVEKERRIVVRNQHLTKQGTDDGGRTPPLVHFRTSRGMLVPFVKLIPNKETAKIPLVRIRSGPTLDKTTAGMAISMLTTKYNFPDVRVSGADIPVRF